MKTIADILQQRDLSVLFQPIIELSSGTFLGYEGLIRGPSDCALHSPLNLFHAARQQGLALEIEMLCRQTVLQAFAERNLPGQLFLNVSPEALLAPGFKDGQTLAYLEKLGLAPDRIIIEITENQPTDDFAAMRNALLHYRSMGFSIAIDDLGEGFSSLRLWSELRPEFVKVDMHFVQGLNSDPLKQQFLKSIQGIALSSGTLVIAEGIETPAEFRTLRDIGIACGQGYFIARPQPVPPLTLPVEAGSLVDAPQPELSYRTTRSASVDSILRYVEPVQPRTEIAQVFTRFSADKSLRAIPVVDHERPVGLINRYEFVDSMSLPYRRELLGKKPCTDMMTAEPLLVEKATPIHELSGFLSESDIRHFTDGFIITEQGRYLGIGTGQDLLREITKAQIETARYANPLTLLPGNVPINEHIERLLNGGNPFAVCYADLDHFKPYNDVCGYRKGDELIQFTARLLGNACDPSLDFLGHIGGDDFMLVMQSPDWEQRCDRILTVFARTSAGMFDKEHRSIGGYLSEDRQGRVVHHPLPTLSLGAVWVDPQAYVSSHQVAEAATVAKKMAKEKPGNSLFVERRQINTPQSPEQSLAGAPHG